MTVPGNLATRLGLEVPTRMGYADAADEDLCEVEASLDAAYGITGVRVGRL